jgi:hypothetical protein
MPYVYSIYVREIFEINEKKTNFRKYKKKNFEINIKLFRNKVNFVSKSKLQFS